MSLFTTVAWIIFLGATVVLVYLIVRCVFTNGKRFVSDFRQSFFGSTQSTLDIQNEGTIDTTHSYKLSTEISFPPVLQTSEPNLSRLAP